MKGNVSFHTIRQICSPARLFPRRAASSSLHGQYALPALERWPSVLAIFTGLALMFYLGFMLFTQNSEHAGVRKTFQHHIVGQTRRLSSFLEMYLEHARKDITALAAIAPVQGDEKRPVHGIASKKGPARQTPSMETAARKLILSSRFDDRAVFKRVLIMDRMGTVMYDTLDAMIPDVITVIREEATTMEAGATIHARRKEIIIAAPIIWKEKSAGHVMAWLDSDTIHSRLITFTDESYHMSSLVSNDGVIYVNDDLPASFMRCDSQGIATMPFETLSSVPMTCQATDPDDMDYLGVKFPIARTPLSVFTILPKSFFTRGVHAWRHAFIMVVLSISLVSLFIMQIRISRRNAELKTRYSEANKQRAAMVENNEKLGKEIILRKQAEAELKIINEHLEDIVKHRTSKLEDAMKDLRNTQSQLIQTGKLASIGELAAGIAHELNQPLMVIRGNTQLMDRMMKKSPPPSKDTPNDTIDQLPSFFETVERNTKRMIMIINHLRSFSRQSGTNMQSVDINQVIKDAFLMIGEQLRLRNIETHKRLTENLPQLKGDPYQLEQVVLNLLSNARDAIEACHPEGEMYRRKKQIIISTGLKMAKGTEYVEMHFSDNGCGITEENREKIFDPFFTTKAVGKGTGLGLSITYGIIQEHKGAMEIVKTQPGHTTFRIVLPVRHIK